MSSSESELVEEIDKLDDEEKFEEIYDKLVRYDGDFKGMSLELMWRLARTCRYLVLTKGRGDKKSKEKWIQTGLDVMKSAVEQYPNECLSNTWYGIMLNVKCAEEGIKNKIKLGYEIRSYFDKGYAANKHDYVTLHCLGSWCYEVSALNRFERVIAKTFFGEPPESSYDEALRFFLEAEQVEPGHIFTLCRITQCYDKLGCAQEAKDWALKAIKLHAPDSEIEEAQRDCRRIAAK
ncbi:unnamed protein product [Hymenolepis diminuta]|uniref:Regulator of microtubule dynamics protein 1 n=1 Tax=Hymenolepis diminuta TaxID=6216 RepID=A0A564YM34_HYMDI|nr:unnamed protein product [Hymenolepis diminuta]